MSDPAGEKTEEPEPLSLLSSPLWVSLGVAEERWRYAKRERETRVDLRGEAAAAKYFEVS